MKQILNLFITALLFIQTINAQVSLNEITMEEYSQIKINNISIVTIINTHGNHTLLKTLFGNELQYKEYDLPVLGRDIWNDNITISFQDDDYTLNFMSLRNSTTVTILGRTAKLGDNVNILGNVVINTNEGDYSVVFVDKDTFTATLAFKINPATKIIEEITYTLF